MYTFLRFLFFFNVFLGFAQNYPQDFDTPLQIDLLPNASFGELRADHFHSGMDFSTKGKKGIPIYAPADGEINRIKVSTFGYGKALYVKHKNGYTTVYGHLEDYAGETEEYVQKEQYRQEKFEVELFPTLHQLPVKKGDIIGYTGNTGGSGGPHLHYEVRDTETEEIINPLFFGLNRDIKDTEAPVLNGLMVYPLQSGSTVNNLQQPFVLSLSRQSDGTFVSQTVYSNGVIGFGVNSYDTSNKSYGKNGLFRVKQTVNGSVTFEMVFDRFSFDETRYVNHYVDYKQVKSKKQWYQKLFTESELPLEMVKTLKHNGKITVNENESYTVKIEVSDFFGNTTTIVIPVVYKLFAVTDTQENSKGKPIDYKRDYIFEEDNLYVAWDAGTFYEDVVLDLNLQNNQITLHKDIIPVHKNIDVRINVSSLSIDKEKAFIGLITKNEIRYFSTWKRDNDFRIRTKTLGTYGIFEDHTPPEIKNPNFKKGEKLTDKDKLTFEISDDLSGIGSYNGFINNQWALFEYDYKTKKLTHKLSDKIAVKGNNEVRIIVIDRVGNNVIFETDFQLN